MRSSKLLRCSSDSCSGLELRDIAPRSCFKELSVYSSTSVCGQGENCSFLTRVVFNLARKIARGVFFGFGIEPFLHAFFSTRPAFQKPMSLAKGIVQIRHDFGFDVVQGNMGKKRVSSPSLVFKIFAFAFFHAQHGFWPAPAWSAARPCQSVSLSALSL